MRNLLLLTFAWFFSLNGALQAGDVVGFWKIPNDKTGQTECIVGVYRYDGKIYGRIIATVDPNGAIEDTIYTPRDRAPGVAGDPFYSGLDMIWDLKPRGSKYVDGKVLDPQKGKVYNAEMWSEGGNLILRGKLWIFGENRVWYPLLAGDMPADFVLPDLNAMVPTIPRTKR